MDFERPQTPEEGAEALDEQIFEHVDAIGVTVRGKVEDGSLKVWGFDEEGDPLESGMTTLNGIDTENKEAVQQRFDEFRRELYGTKQSDIGAAQRQNHRSGIDPQWGQR